MPLVAPAWKTLAIGAIGFIVMAIALFAIFQMGERDRIAFESAPTPICNDMAPLGYVFFGFYATMLAGAVVGCLAILASPAGKYASEKAFEIAFKTFGITAIIIIVTLPLLVLIGTSMMSGSGALNTGNIGRYLSDAMVIAVVIGFLTLPGFFSAGVSGVITGRIFRHK